MPRRPAQRGASWRLKEWALGSHLNMQNKAKNTKASRCEMIDQLLAPSRQKRVCYCSEAKVGPSQQNKCLVKSKPSSEGGILPSISTLL